MIIGDNSYSVVWCVDEPEKQRMCDFLLGADQACEEIGIENGSRPMIC